jgi:hypothetical protein
VQQRAYSRDALEGSIARGTLIHSCLGLVVLVEAISCCQVTHRGPGKLLDMNKNWEM